MDASWTQDAKYSAYWAQQQSLGQKNLAFLKFCLRKQKYIVSIVDVKVSV